MVVNRLDGDPDRSPRSADAAESAYNISGAAAGSRISEYRDNSGEVPDRTLEALVAWAASKGLLIPNYIKIVPYHQYDGLDGFPLRNDRAVDAKYFEAKFVTERESVAWDDPRDPYRSVFNRSFDAAVINVAHAVMLNDERFLHVVAHEVYEIEALKGLFADCGGRISTARFFELTEPLENVQNLHWYAWEYADSFIEQLRRERSHE